MPETYFSARPTSRRRPAAFVAKVRGHAFTVHGDAGVFSRGELDRGTEVLADALELGSCEFVLDLGCGTGILGMLAARLSEGGHVILTDANARAVALAKKNLAANRVANAEVRSGDLYGPVKDLAFDHIVCNPPLRAGRRVVDRIIAEAPRHLHEGGSLWLVARTRQGAEAIRDRMADAFGNAEVVKRGSGYKVLRSVKGAAGP